MSSTFLTKYEVTEVLAMRSLLIYDGANPLLNVSNTRLKKMTPIDIARQELVEGRILFLVRRRGADGVLIEYPSSALMVPPWVRDHMFNEENALSHSQANPVSTQFPSLPSLQTGPHHGQSR